MPCAHALERLWCNPSDGMPMPFEYFTENNPTKAEIYNSCLEDEFGVQSCINLALYGETSPTCPADWSFDMSLMFEDEQAFMEMQNACPGQLVNTVTCTPESQIYNCYGATCGGWGGGGDCNGFDRLYDRRRNMYHG